MSHKGPSKTPPDMLAMQKYHRMRRARGVPELMGHEAAVEAADVLKRWHGTGMTYYQMAAQIGLSEATLSNVVTLQRGRVKGAVVGIHRKTYTAIMRIRFEEPEKYGARMPMCGVQRRLQALQRAGYPLAVIGREMGGRHGSQIGYMAKRGGDYTFYRVWFETKTIFDKLITTDPADLGVTPRQINRATIAAVRNGHAPWSAWDEDTIDEPDAYPEWTGACGTMDGYRIHRKLDIPVCAQCKRARNIERGNES